MMGRFPGAVILLFALTVPLRAQLPGVPGVRRVNCAEGTTLLGRPVHEDDGTLSGAYLTARDSTYLIAFRTTNTVRAFVPFIEGEYAGQGPFQPQDATLGFTVNQGAREMSQAADNMPATLILEDFTTYKLGNVRFGPIQTAPSGLATVRVSMDVPGAAMLKLVHGRSGLVKWGKWHVDLEQSDIGIFRGFERALACAPAGLGRQDALAGDIADAAVPAPTSEFGKTDAVSSSWSVYWTFLSGSHRDESSIRALRNEIVERTSCPAADSLLGPPHGEFAGALGGGYDRRVDTTFLALFDEAHMPGFPFYFNTEVHQAGRGPFDPRMLGLGFTLPEQSSLDRWTDTMHATMILDDSDTLALGTIRLSQPARSCCTAPLQVTFALTKAAQLALFKARKAEVRWAAAALVADSVEIGLVRAFDRTLICAPHSLDAKFTSHGN